MTKSKPENSHWTEAQWRAITAEGHDLLVAAAAGSGKTAVLVERIIRKIMDQQQRTSLDSLLVVTFTKAAAAEMRERISRAIDRKLSDNPADLYLRRQQALLGKASIMTLHSFCSSVIRRFYYKREIDPNFRLVDEVEAALIREEVLDTTLENYYQAGDTEFFRLVERYSGDRSDDALRSLIFRLYDFSLSDPWPENWLDQMAAAYRQNEERLIDDFSWAQDLKRSAAIHLQEAVSELREALNLCHDPQGPAVYAETIEAELVNLSGLPDVVMSKWSDIRSAVLALTFGKLKTCRDKSVDEVLKEQVKKARDRAKTIITDLQSDWFRRTADESLADLADMAGSVKMMRAIIADFSKAYQAEKRKKGLLDFNDLEHNCLAVLRAVNSVPEREIPSEAAQYYQTKFSEILIDEYQDTNRVQETILSLISRDASRGGNRFMVGDVKQSIYGFRLAEPGLFLGKYKLFSEASTSGEKIDLSSNFRSRQEIINGTNFIFRQIMDESVGGVAYDPAAELRYGAAYPEYSSPVELEIIDKKSVDKVDDSDDSRESIEIEATAIADRIAAMIGDGKTGAYQVCDKSSGQMRALRYRDIAILMRAASGSAAVVKEALQSRNIPAYAELSSGYFDTIEVTVMLSLLQIIDNPYQDIPLASVLRSPLFGFSGDELAAIRIADQHSGYFEALKKYSLEKKDPLAERILYFLEKLNDWRALSKKQSVSQLIWQIYRDTGYFDYVGGLSGGTQRQANLGALYDRAMQYEQTSFRGLFRFLRFINRMRETGGDMGEARALSEQADVVRIMTIHKSKGLEFPIVFVAGLGKQFNMRDTVAPALLHKSMGFGTRWIDPKQRISVPTLLYLAIKERIRADALAEEMRVLYVALTRAREKLILIGTVRDLEKSASKWQRVLNRSEWLLPDAMRRSTSAFIDWLGPAVIRHAAAGSLHEARADAPEKTAITCDPSAWLISCVSAESIQPAEAVQAERDAGRLDRIKQWKTVVSFSGYQDEVVRRLNWSYPFESAAYSMAKQTVTEIKVQQDYFSEGQDNRLLHADTSVIGGERPRFLQQNGLTAAERGTAVHLLMQHLDLKAVLSEASIRQQGQLLVHKEILTAQQEEELPYLAITRFFQSAIGQEMLRADKVIRECPFSLSVDAASVYPSGDHVKNCEKDKVLIQGVIDCIIETHSGLILIDYKTDHLRHLYPEPREAARELKQKYQVQLSLYRTAIERIWKQKVDKVGLYAFDCDLYVDFSGERGILE